MIICSYKGQYYCGIDLHARKMYVCILDQKGKTMIHENIKTDPELFFQLISPYLEDIVVGVECIFCWYWVSDLCAKHNIPFTLGHALYMKAIHGGKTKNDKIDSYKIALLCLRAEIFRQPIRIRQSALIRGYLLHMRFVKKSAASGNGCRDGAEVSRSHSRQGLYHSRRCGG